MALVSSAVTLLAEEAAESEELVPLPPIVYGVIAFVLLMVLLIVTTRINLDR
jgi:hypothetical protein